MIPRARSAIVAVAILAVAGCGTGPGPSGPVSSAVASGSDLSSARPNVSDRPDPSVVVLDQLGGPWRYSPVIVDDAHVAIVSDACAAKARETLDEAAANLPTALVDARGEHLVTVVMADDLNAIECLAHLDGAGTAATVDSVDRLSMVAVAPVEKAAITVASVVLDADPPGGRTIAFGRIGPDADAAKAGFGDNSTVLGSKANGWWAMWWPGAVRANQYAATDTHDLVIGSAKPPTGEVEARVMQAAWWVDPKAATPTAASTTIHAIVHELACANGAPPKGRIEPPAIELTDTSVIVTYSVRLTAGGADCPGNPPFAVDLKLPESLGKRALLDGNDNPPRDATMVPSN